MVQRLELARTYLEKVIFCYNLYINHQYFNCTGMVVLKIIFAVSILWKMFPPTWTRKVRPGTKLLMLRLKLLWYLCNAGFIYSQEENGLSCFIFGRTATSPLPCPALTQAFSYCLRFHLHFSTSKVGWSDAQRKAWQLEHLSISQPTLIQPYLAHFRGDSVRGLPAHFKQ